MPSDGLRRLRRWVWSWVAEPGDTWWEIAVMAALPPGLFALAGAGAYLVVVTQGAPGGTLLGIVAVLAAAAVGSHLTPADRHAEVRLG